MKKSLKITLGVIGGIVLLFAVDLICIFTFNRPLLAIKKDNGDSVNVIYKGLLYDTYLCHEFSVPQIKQKGAKFTCAEIEFDKQDKLNYKPTEIKGISMTIKDGTLTNKGATIIIKDTNGKGTYVYGTEFDIQKKENGNWVKPKKTGNECGFNSMAYYVDDNGLLEFEQNWHCMYGELEKGTYRLVKSTFLESDKPITEDDQKYFSIEFTID